MRGVKMKKFWISFGIALICFSLIFVGLDKLVLSKKNSSISKEENEEYAEGEENEEDDLELEEPKQKNKDELLVLLMGVDAKDVKKSKGARSDTMMLININFKTGKIDLLSIPRDTRVLIKGKEDKINHAHANGGAALSIRTVREFLNIDLDYYVKVDYKAVIEIVEEIGGVYIDVPRYMKYDDPTADPPLHIDIKKGFQLLDGKNSHDFLRWRKNNDLTVEIGDIGRIEMQQMFMKELIKQTLKPKNIFKIPSFVETYYDYVETNIPLTLMAKGALSAKKIDTETMVTNTIPGESKTIAKISYWIYNKDETQEIVKEMFGDYLLD